MEKNRHDITGNTKEKSCFENRAGQIEIDPARTINTLFQTPINSPASSFPG